VPLDSGNWTSGAFVQEAHSPKRRIRLRDREQRGESVFFECRRQVPALADAPPAWREVAETYARGDLLGAYQALGLLEAPETPLLANLAAEVARGVGREDEYRDRSEAAWLRWPGDALLTLQRARVLCMRGRLLSAERLLDAFVDYRTEVPEIPGAEKLGFDPLKIARALQISVAAQSQREGWVRAQTMVLEADGVLEDPLAAYEVSYALYELRDWPSALSLLERVVRACPDWPRPYVFIHRCLSALDRSEEAGQRIVSAGQRLPWSSILASLQLSHLYALRRWPELETKTQALIESLPPEPPEELSSDDGKLGHQAALRYSTRRMALGLRVWALWELNRREEAIEAAREIHADFAALLEKAVPGAPRCRLEVPPLVQDKNMCVAASVAMVLRGRGMEADPAEIYSEMGGSAGVTSWKLDAWLRQRGLEPVDLRLDLEVLRGALDLGLPLLATRSHLVMSHMELLIGYDEGIEQLEALDPAEGLPHHVPYAALSAVYGQAGSSLVAFVPAPKGQVEAVEIPEAWVDQEARKTRLVKRALYEGDLEAARERLAELTALDPLSARAARLRSGYPEVFVPDGDVVADVERLARDPEVDLNSRLDALLRLTGTQSEIADEVARELRPKLPPFFRTYLRLLRARNRGDWPLARRCAELILERAAALPDPWHALALSLEATGHVRFGQRARGRCLDVEPEHVHANLEQIGSSRGGTLEERLARAEELLALHPRAEPLYRLTAQLLNASGRPLEAEARLQENVRLGPYSAAAVVSLRGFYLSQGRLDLAEGVELPLALRPLDSEEALVDRDFEALLGQARFLLAPPSLAAAERPAQPAIESAEAAEADPRLEAEQALAELLRRQEAGSLRANEDLDLRRLLLTRALLQGSGLDPEQVREILPKTLPVPRAALLDSFLDELPPPGPPVARLLLGWVDEVMEGEEWTPLAEFQRAFLLECAGEFRPALEAYETLSADESSPAASSAWFRRGEIAVRRGGTPREAASCYEQCLALAPSAIGCLVQLAVLYRQQLGDREGSARALSALTRLAPYDVSHAQEYLNLLDEAPPPEAAREIEAWLREEGSRYPESFRRAWKARIFLRRDEPKKALGLVDRAGAGDPPQTLREADPREAKLVEYEAWEQLGTLSVARLRAGLAEFPDDTYFRHCLAQALLEKEPAEASQLYLAALEATPSPVVARAAIEAAIAAKSFVQIVSGFAERVRSAAVPLQLLRACGEALLDAGRGDLAIDLCERLEPSLGDETRFLIYSLELHERCGLAASVAPLAEQLLTLDPGPGARWCAGRILLATNPQRARELFEDYYAQTDDPDGLSQIGRCLEAAGEEEAAVAAYRTSLEAHGLDADPGAVAGLLRLAPGPDLWPACRRVLQLPPREDVDGIAVEMVRLALRMRAEVPPSWFDWAAVRFDHLRRQGESQELETLSSMLRVWAIEAHNEALVVMLSKPWLQRLWEWFRPWSRWRGWAAAA
jgi:tetratricopeptide (TPR) repeat protein